LDASEICLERPICRDWTGDWQTTGKHGHVMVDGDDFLIYATTPEKDRIDPDGIRRCYGSPRRWGNFKKTLGFAPLIQEAEDEGIFRLDRLPNEAEAEAIRTTLGIRKRRHQSPEERERASTVLASVRSLHKSGFPAKKIDLAALGRPDTASDVTAPSEMLV
jgi:hypothetical protein